MFRISGSETFLNFFIHFLITDYILEIFLKIYFLEKLDISFASIFTYCIKNYYTNSIIAILMHYKKKKVIHFTPTKSSYFGHMLV